MTAGEERDLTARQRLARLVRERDADLGEAALLVCADADRALDVEAQLLRLDAIADGLATSERRLTGDPVADARALAGYLAVDQGFHGDEVTRHDPRNALLVSVLDRKRGLPITLAMLYVAIGRRAGVPVFPITLPGHVVAGVAGGDRPAVLDPFHGGRLLDEAALTARVHELTDGALEFRRHMLRPADAPTLVRRLLGDLTRDFTNLHQYAQALWSVEVKLALPNWVPDDHRVRGELLAKVGRFDDAADAFRAYVEMVPDAPDRAEVAQLAIHARAKLN